MESDCVASQGLELSIGDLNIGVSLGDGHTVSSIRLDLPVPDFDRWLPSLTPGAGTTGNPHRIAFEDPPQAERLLNTLQYLESLGSFWLGIKRIHWNDAKWEWVPESDSERGRLAVFSVSRSQSYERRAVPFRPQILRQLLEAETDKSWLTIPMSFLREGHNDYEAHRYVNAFYNFYFFLEDLFGHGKTKNRHILEAFRSSADLKLGVAKAYSQCSDYPGKQEAIDSLIEAVGGATTPDGLLEFLVGMRGELHHFSRRSSRPKGHPLNQHEFQPLGFFVMSICLNVLPKLITGARPPDDT
jgi:hypothetical protein